ncbi:hypothetical protein [Streptomyces sp. STR69]|nr:hypothetical protein [Streptomyces sp. STR69]
MSRPLCHQAAPRRARQRQRQQWGLSIDAVERDALNQQLADCPD